MLQLLTFCALVLCVSPTTTPGPVAQQVVQTRHRNACSLIVCPPAERGLPGTDGRDGRDGLQGPKGERGEQGPKGNAGAEGPQGAPGPKGDRGSVGEKGSKGDVGARGLQGATGPQGPEGRTGPPGSKGDKGSTGEKGTKGDSGLSEVNYMKNKVSALERQLKTLQSSFSKYQKVAAFPGGRIVGNKVFISSGYEGNFNDLRQRCWQAGGQLASPRNYAENIAIKDIVVLYQKSAFLGITDIQTEGTFRYSNGERIVYSNWEIGEPNNQDVEEDCIEVYSSGKWNDKSCGERRLIICEF
nr:pulmonary surfactant-associated protein D-like [Anolis sagrei ordinatus]